MKRAIEAVAAGRWPGNDVTDTVTLSFDDRHRRRFLLTTDAGADLLLDLPETVALADGDGLRLDQGGWVAVVAALEPLLEVASSSPAHLARLAWHIGNRHLQAEMLSGRIHIRRDHVIADMLRGLGANVREVMAPFQPEGGAYAAGVAYTGHSREGHTHG